MKKSFFYRIMILSLGVLLASIIACQNPHGTGGQTSGGGTTNPGGQTPGGGTVNPKTDQEKVEAAKAALKLRVNGKVRDWINLSRWGAYNTSISWTSSPSEIINTNEPDVGKVTRQDDDAVVTLTATITKGSATATKTFTVTVYGKNQELVDRAIPGYVAAAACICDGQRDTA